MREMKTVAISFANWLSKNEWSVRMVTHPKYVGSYWSFIHCEYKTIEQLYDMFIKENPELLTP